MSLYRSILFPFFILFWSISNIPMFNVINKLPFQNFQIYTYDLIIIYLILNFFMLKIFQNFKQKNILLFLFFFTFILLTISILIKGTDNILSDSRLYVYSIFFVYLYNYFNSDNISSFLDQIIFISLIVLAYSFILRLLEFGFIFPKKSQLFRYDALFLTGYFCCFIKLILKKNKNFKYYFFISLFLLFYALEGVRTVLLINLTTLLIFTFLFKRNYFSKIFIIIFIFFGYISMPEIIEYIFKPIINVDDTFLVRIMAWKDLYTKIISNIFFGHGFGADSSINKYFSTSGGDLFIGTSHNVFLTLLYLIGIFGMLPFCYLILKVIFFNSNYISHNINLFLKFLLILTLVYFSFQPLGPDFYVSFWVIYGLTYTIQRKVNI